MPALDTADVAARSSEEQPQPPIEGSAPAGEYCDQIKRSPGSVERSPRDKSDDAPSDAAPAPEAATVATRESKRPWYWRWVDNGPAVLAILFLVTGALGLPLLYHSRAFSVRWKWVIAIANIAYTTLSCYWAYLEVTRYMTILYNAIEAL